MANASIRPSSRLYNVVVVVVVGKSRRPNQVQGESDNGNASRVPPEDISHAALERNLP